MRDLLSGGRFLNCGNYGIGEKCTKERLAKVLDPALCTSYLKNIRMPCHFPLTFDGKMSLFMRGVFLLALI